MKRIIIGDPHGRFDLIKKIYDKEDPDAVIIVGDYFDSFDVNPVDQYIAYDNLLELRENHLKHKYGDFIMLIGNHDMHYIDDEKFGRCSGWNYDTNSYANYRLNRDSKEGILKVSYIDYKNKTIYSHAGVSSKWYNKYCDNLDQINLQLYNNYQFTYKDGGDYFGSSPWNSPLWIRPNAIREYPYTDENGEVWSQVFGHTQSLSPSHWKKDNADFYCIDCIQSHYLIEEIDYKQNIVSRTLGNTVE